jgi:lipopolysaccharide cholinephosphotransferase
MKEKIKKNLRKIFRKLTGMNYYEEEIDTLFYFLNSYVDITKAPKAKGDLRKLQTGDFILLQIFHEICEKNHLTYWLDYGTLLGAYRHKGFIPWDDDVDVSMPREDYNRALNLFETEFRSYGIDAKEEKDELMQRIGIGYKHKSTGVWIDVFPVDKIYTDEIIEKNRDEINDRVMRYRKLYLKHKDKKDRNFFETKKEKIIGSSELCNGKNEVYFHGPENFIDYTLYTSDMLFPLQKIKFEDDYFYVPHDTEGYLQECYSKGMEIYCRAICY